MVHIIYLNCDIFFIHTSRQPSIGWPHSAFFVMGLPSKFWQICNNALINSFSKAFELIPNKNIQRCATRTDSGRCILSSGLLNLCYCILIAISWSLVYSCGGKMTKVLLFFFLLFPRAVLSPTVFLFFFELMVNQTKARQGRMTIFFWHLNRWLHFIRQVVFQYTHLRRYNLRRERQIFILSKGNGN